MIDLHCHLLPGIDDGPKDIATTLAMARIAVADGIGTIFCTPHIYPGLYENAQSDIIDRVDQLRTILQRENIPLKRYHYGVRICPEPVYWGGLSGSPYSEAISWGKFVPPADGGKFGEVFLDATVGLPLIVAAVLERLGKSKGAGKKKKKARK